MGQRQHQQLLITRALRNTQHIRHTQWTRQSHTQSKERHTHRQADRGHVRATLPPLPRPALPFVLCAEDNRRLFLSLPALLVAPSATLHLCPPLLSLHALYLLSPLHGDHVVLVVAVVVEQHPSPSGVGLPVLQQQGLHGGVRHEGRAEVAYLQGRGGGGVRAVCEMDHNKSSCCR